MVEARALALLMRQLGRKAAFKHAEETHKVADQLMDWAAAMADQLRNDREIFETKRRLDPSR
ncbi:MAG TPA: hypothetical protein VK446_08220 [Methylocystis sp.]|nr:hypothetical protein [Methylocystis sp.]